MKNLNQLAKEVCKFEGKKQELSIAQVKEVIRCIVDLQVHDINHDDHYERLVGIRRESPIGLMGGQAIFIVMKQIETLLKIKKLKTKPKKKRVKK